MRKKFDRVSQFKITLKRVKPPIWRRIHVPETYTFWDLHVAIQDVMGWLDCHLHHFEILNPSTSMQEEIGIPDEDMEWDRSILPGWKQKISDFFQGIIRNQIIYMIMAIIGSIPTLHHFLFTPTRTLPHQGGGDI